MTRITCVQASRTPHRLHTIRPGNFEQ